MNSQKVVFGSLIGAISILLVFNLFLYYGESSLVGQYAGTFSESEEDNVDCDKIDLPSDPSDCVGPGYYAIYALDNEACDWELDSVVCDTEECGHPDFGVPGLCATDGSCFLVAENMGQVCGDTCHPYHSIGEFSCLTCSEGEVVPDPEQDGQVCDTTGTGFITAETGGTCSGGDCISWLDQVIFN